MITTLSVQDLELILAHLYAREADIHFYSIAKILNAEEEHKNEMHYILKKLENILADTRKYS